MKNPTMKEMTEALKRENKMLEELIALFDKLAEK